MGRQGTGRCHCVSCFLVGARVAGCSIACVCFICANVGAPAGSTPCLCQRHPPHRHLSHRCLPPSRRRRCGLCTQLSRTRGSRRRTSTCATSQRRGGRKRWWLLRARIATRPTFPVSCFHPQTPNFGWIPCASRMTCPIPTPPHTTAHRARPQRHAPPHGPARQGDPHRRLVAAGGPLGRPREVLPAGRGLHPGGARARRGRDGIDGGARMLLAEAVAALRTSRFPFPMVLCSLPACVLCCGKLHLTRSTYLSTLLFRRVSPNPAHAGRGAAQPEAR